MTNPNFAADSVEYQEATDGRRRELRALLVSAADAARQGRRVRGPAARAAGGVGHAIRERVATLVAAAN